MFKLKWVPLQPITIDEEIEAAKQTQTVISRLSTSSALRKVKDVAAHAFQ
jgi:hypothetical protein